MMLIRMWEYAAKKWAKKKILDPESVSKVPLSKVFMKTKKTVVECKVTSIVDHAFTITISRAGVYNGKRVWNYTKSNYVYCGTECKTYVCMEVKNGRYPYDWMK